MTSGNRDSVGTCKAYERVGAAAAALAMTAAIRSALSGDKAGTAGLIADVEGMFGIGADSLVDRFPFFFSCIRIDSSLGFRRQKS